MWVELTLLIWNVHGLPFIGAKPKEIAKVIETHPADLYFLQEVFTHRMRNSIVGAVKPETETWQKRAGLLYLQKGEKAPDLMISHHNYFKQTTWSRFDFLVRKGFISSINSDWVKIVNTHLDAGADISSTLVRMQQFEEIMKYADVGEGPLIIAGDLNMKMTRPDDAFAVQRLMEKYRLTGYWTDTDYILVRGVELTGVQVVYSPASDHSPIIIKVRYNNED